MTGPRQHPRDRSAAARPAGVSPPEGRVAAGGRNTARAARRPLHDAYAVCPPGIEAICASEARALGVRAVKAERGGVSFRATTRQLYAANLWLRSATRVLVRVAQFEAGTFAELQAQAREVVLDEWLGERTPRLRVSASRARLYHTDAIAERLHEVWGGGAEPADRQAGRRAGGVDGQGGPASSGHDDASEDDDSQLFVVRNVGNHFTVSADCSGQPLYKRGWRHEVAKAPLRENMAAALLLAVGWNGSTALLDPFCGSGTIAIEAALLAAGRPPGFLRSFALFDWPAFEAGTWASVVGQAAEAESDTERALPPIVAADRDAGAVAATLANAERAGVSDLVQAVHRSVSDTVGPDGAGDTGWVVTNPPYGARIDHGGDLRNLYSRFGDMARDRLAGWSIGLLVADRRLAAHTALSLHEQLRFNNGGIEVELLVGEARPRRPRRRS